MKSPVTHIRCNRYKLASGAKPWVRVEAYTCGDALRGGAYLWAASAGRGLFTTLSYFSMCVLCSDKLLGCLLLRWLRLQVHDLSRSAEALFDGLIMSLLSWFSLLLSSGTYYIQLMMGHKIEVLALGGYSLLMLFNIRSLNIE